jgi:methylase of polypeptide subunit release factors
MLIRVPTSHPQSPQSAPRELGSVYTPPEIAAGIVRGCLDSWSRKHSERTGQDDGGQLRSGPPRILDPACGDGAFLLAVFDELIGRMPAQELSAAQRLAIVRDQIFGVDIDPPAAAAARSRLLERMDLPAELATEAATVLEQNIRCGDSLLGPDFTLPRQLQPGLWPEDPLPQQEVAISWLAAFPAVAAAGGFDIVVGNPPYLRERSAKALFDRLAASDLGRRWREARMDLWYYFVHRSLDLLRPNGVLGFIVNSYWTSSRGAGRLIERLARETLFEEIQLLNDEPVFQSIAGRHMIFRLLLRSSNEMGISRRVEQSSPPCVVVPSVDPHAERYTITQADLFQNGRLVLARPTAEQYLFTETSPLEKSFRTRQGIAENPPCINRRLCQEFEGKFAVGTGVFVLTADEVDMARLSPAEKSLLRPYFDTRFIRRYELPTQPSHQLLYLTKQTAPDLDSFPEILAHLERFRPILERRREVQMGRCQWWHLHWPRDEEIFLGPKTLSVQMGKRPQFVFSGEAAFVGFSVNLVLPGQHPGCPLETLTGILNSDLAFRWFERHAKRRGVNLEINAHVLREFPLPGRDESIEAKIAERVLARQSTPDAVLQAQAEGEIETLVGRLYADATASRVTV